MRTLPSPATTPLPTPAPPPQAASTKPAPKPPAARRTPPLSPPAQPLANPPAIVKAVYFTGWSAGLRRRVDYLVDLHRTTAINAVVIDIKDYSGNIAYAVTAPEARQYGAVRVMIRDFDGLVNRLHHEGLYVIARLTVFQDPVLAEARPDLAVHRVSKLPAAQQPQPTASAPPGAAAQNPVSPPPRSPRHPPPHRPSLLPRSPRAPPPLTPPSPQRAPPERRRRTPRASRSEAEARRTHRRLPVARPQGAGVDRPGIPPGLGLRRRHRPRRARPRRRRAQFRLRPLPSDGDLNDMYFPNWDGQTPKHEVIRQFFGYLRKQLGSVRISADLFGLATINNDDLGIGQVIEDAYGSFDAVCPMGLSVALRPQVPRLPQPGRAPVRGGELLDEGSAKPAGGLQPSQARARQGSRPGRRRPRRRQRSADGQSHRLRWWETRRPSSVQRQRSADGQGQRPR